ncbi:hypothetical protein [Rhodococcus rhodochrous]|uniref:DUF4190 domain-containing protein n=1 Tax=Rhodococcus rhodochrous KG-21 TaxID=1441923 RepID=A0A0M8PG93_RHORH|nr:hypothetical protein [Rhodococcus rhodochrous]KOS55944.1 hypothetical protein Z051_12170 [Rhodococcus rhodochrous KG-21]
MSVLQTPFRSGPHRARLGFPALSRLRETVGDKGADLALMLGALSIVTFWTFGFGILLGAAAVGTGIAATRRPTVFTDEAKSLDALVGMLTGIFGILAGVVFLSWALPHL